jgi:uncharacterized protein YndB with AHSA1/START domain
MNGSSGIPPIVIEIRTPADPGRAWQAVTDPTDVAEWFADVSPAAAVGAPYRVDFGDGSAVEGVIRALEPGRRLTYTWAWAGEPGPTTLVTWDVTTDGVGARITFTHDGWAEAHADRATRDEHAEYWESYLDTLRAYLGGDAP